MVDRRGQPSLAEKAVADLVVACDGGPDELERHVAFENLVARAVDHTHATRSEPTKDLEVRDSAGAVQPTATVALRKCQIATHGMSRAKLRPAPEGI